MTNRSLLCLLCAAVGCARAAAPGPSPDAEPSVAPEQTPARASVQAPDRLIGEWVMAPPPHEKRSVDLARLALAEPPDDEGFERMNPSPKEREHYTNLLRLKNEEPGSYLLVAVRQKLDALEAVRVTFTPEKMIMSTAGGTDMVPYAVEEDLGDQVVIVEGGDTSKRRAIAFADDNNIVITVGPTRIPMTRVPSGQAPAPTSAPTSVAPAAGAGVDEFDACVAEYYRCIEQMPADARAATQDLITATKAIFERAKGSPADRASTLASCRQAVDLAYASYCTPPAGRE